MKNNKRKKKYTLVALIFISECFLCSCGLVNEIMNASGNNKTPHASERPLLVGMQSYDQKDNALETWDYSYDEKDRLIGMVRKQANPDSGEMTLFETDSYEYFENGTYKQTIVYHIDSGEKHVITLDENNREIYNITDILVNGNSIHTEYATEYETKKGMETATIKTVGTDYYYTTTKTFNEHGDATVYVISDSEGSKSTYSDEYTYDKAGRIINIVQTDDAGFKMITTYEYESDNKKPAYETKETLLGLPGSELSVSKMKINYVYDGNANLVEENYEYEKVAATADSENLLGKVVYIYQE